MKISARIWYAVCIAIGASVPFVSHAQEGVDTNTFVNSLPLWIAVIVGIVASMMVLANAKKIGKSELSKVYNCFGIGMLLVVLGFLAVVVKPWAAPSVIMRTHDVLFVLGYVIMAFGAGRMLKAAGLK